MKGAREDVYVLRSPSRNLTLSVVPGALQHEVMRRRPGTSFPRNNEVPCLRRIVYAAPRTERR
jgi:hypothetical protein